MSDRCFCLLWNPKSKWWDTAAYKWDDALGFLLIISLTCLKSEFHLPFFGLFLPFSKEAVTVSPFFSYSKRHQLLLWTLNNIKNVSNTNAKYFPLSKHFITGFNSHPKSQAANSTTKVGRDATASFIFLWEKPASLVTAVCVLHGPKLAIKDGTMLKTIWSEAGKTSLLIPSTATVWLPSGSRALLLPAHHLLCSALPFAQECPQRGRCS